MKYEKMLLLSSPLSFLLSPALLSPLPFSWSVNQSFPRAGRGSFGLTDRHWSGREAEYPGKPYAFVLYISNAFMLKFILTINAKDGSFISIRIKSIHY